MLAERALQHGAITNADAPTWSRGARVALCEFDTAGDCGVRNEQGLSPATSQSPPWWQSWWFGGAVLAVLAALVIGAAWWRVLTLRRRSRLLASQVAKRIKELNCLYGISRLVEAPGVSLEDVLQGTVELIPPAWQYPEITCAKITLEGRAYTTKSFAESPWMQTADIIVQGERSGSVRVGYVEERPPGDSASGGTDPFSAEERDLLDAIAGRLGRIVERMRAEQLVRHHHQSLRLVLDSLAHPFYVINARTHIVEMANAAAHDGPLPEGITCHALMHGRDRPCDTEPLCPLKEVRRTKQPVRVEHAHVDAEGRRRDVEVHGFPIFDGDGDLVQMIEYTVDITERKRAEEQMAQDQARLAALAERERIGRELHDDLAQVIAYIGFQAQAARVRLGQGETAMVQAILGSLVETAQKAQGDVRRYILGIRSPERMRVIQSPERRPAPHHTAARAAGAGATAGGDFFTELEQYLETIRERYGLQVRVSWPEKLLASPLAPKVETQLLRITQEALTNVRTHAGVDEAQLLFTVSDNHVQVVIEDGGRGFVARPDVPEGEQGEHFGLQIMRERAESAGGTLEVRSAPEEGTRVIVRLPCALGPTLDTGLAGPTRVLLADDHPLYLEGLRSLLESRGLHVIGQANDGLEALELARALRPDLILMDVRMPRCDGVEATRRIKAELPLTRIVMLTMAADGERLFEALKSGASGYLLKSLDGRQFFGLLAQVLEGETVLSPSLAEKVLDEFARREAEAAPDVEDLPVLTARQRDVLELVAQGLTNKGIAQALHVSERTIKYHVSQILERLHMRSRHELARYAHQEGMALPPAAGWLFPWRLYEYCTPYSRQPLPGSGILS